MTTAPTPPPNLTANEQKLIANLLEEQSMFTQSRNALLSKMIDGPNRSINEECNYPETISAAEYRGLFNREGIATRVVSILPNECWTYSPEIIESEKLKDSKFELAVKQVVQKTNLFGMCERGDVLSGIGRFGIILLGLTDGKELSKPVTGRNADGTYSRSKKYKLAYLRTFSEEVVTIDEVEKDPKSVRYGLPTMYSVNFAQPNAAQSDTLQKSQIHWTRVIHLADNLTNSLVYGTPRMEPVYNRLLDLRKVLGGSGEVYWKGAFPGLSFELMPEMANAEIDTAGLRKEIEGYYNGMRRYLALKGMTAKSLQPQVTDPGPHAKVHYQAICAAQAIPENIFLGSQEAKLASSKDMEMWLKRLKKRLTSYVAPCILRPLIDAFIGYGILPVPKGGEDAYIIKWPDLAIVSENDKADIAMKFAQALSQYVGAGVDTIMPPLEFLTHVMRMDQDTAEEVIAAAKKFISGDMSDDELTFDEVSEAAAKAKGATNPAPAPGAKPAPAKSASRDPGPVVKTKLKKPVGKPVQK